MERRFKERLIGAIVLVGLGVLVLPAVLKGPRPSGQPDAMKVEGSPRSETIELEPQENIAAQRHSPPAPKPAAAEKPASPEPPPAAAEPSELQSPAPKSTPDAEPASPAPAPVVPPSGAWAVQVGTFANASNAEKLSAGLKSRGYPVFVVRTTDDKTYFRVRVGPEPDEASAQALKRRLAADDIDGVLVRNP